MIRVEWGRANLIGFGFGLGVSCDYTRMGGHITEWVEGGVFQVKDYSASLTWHLGPRNLVLRMAWHSPRFFIANRSRCV